MATIDELVDELDRTYHETHERLSDPAVYNDHREAAEVGRRLKELEGPHRLAQAWQGTRDDLEAARGEPELRELVPETEQRLAELEEELRLALAPKDPADRKDVIVEIRQGVGGDEAAIWAGDLYRMLTRYAEGRGFKVEDLGSSPNDGSGFKEVTFAVKGDAARRSQIGSGERSEKIRTYNFPENRVTDHRIKLTVHQLDRILQGQLGEFTDALAAEEQRAALE